MMKVFSQTDLKLVSTWNRQLGLVYSYENVEKVLYLVDVLCSALNLALHMLLQNKKEESKAVSECFFP